MQPDLSVPCFFCRFCHAMAQIIKERESQKFIITKKKKKKKKKIFYHHGNLKINNREH